VSKPKRFGLVLAGGASLALTHIGVFRALEERGMKPVAIAGVSAGAIVGSLIAAGMSHEELLDATAQVRWRRLVSPALRAPGLLRLDKMGKYVEERTGADNIEKLPLPMRIVTTDLATGRPVVHRKGRLGETLAASCSIPGIFSPVKLDGRMHVDGGLNGNLPLGALDDFRSLDFVIASDPVTHCELNPRPDNMYKVLLQTFLISLKATTRIPSECAHPVIRIEPRLAAIDPFNLKELHKMEPAGYEAAEMALEEAGV
jgi:NTE family protein